MEYPQRFQDFIKQTTININGTITPAQAASISVFDRGFLYGDSIYEVTYSEDGNLVFFDEHLRRLYNSAELLNMHIFLERDYIIQEVMKTLKHSQLKRAYIRIILTRGETEINLDPNISFKNNLIIIVKPQPEYPQKYYDQGLHLIISSVLRNDRKSINPNAKSGNYLNNVMAINEAKKIGADDAIMVNHEGFVTEGTTFNIWLVSEGVIITPPESSGLLKGITREKVLKICKELQLNYKVQTVTPEMILSAQEVFITSSTKGIMPVYRIGDVNYSNERPITHHLMQLYKVHLQAELKQQKYYYL